MVYTSAEIVGYGLGGSIVLFGIVAVVKFALIPWIRDSVARKNAAADGNV